MALLDFQILPGIDKQNTTKGAENRWIDSDNVRFRYGLPEKVGGWASLVNSSIVGAVRNQHSFVDTDGNKYIALGTDKFLLLYFNVIHIIKDSYMTSVLMTAPVNKLALH